MKVAAVLTDLMLYSRIASAARVAGAELARVDDPHQIPRDADLVLVDWEARQPDWGDAVASLADARVIVFGPHVDVKAHEAAREAGVGPMWARSRLLSGLPDLLRSPPTGSVRVPRAPA
jgi:hypothetical protein